jgi:CheY-like chemotaxis protein
MVHFIDNGRGITPDLLAEIFDIFIQGERSFDRAEGGLGLGLSMARNIINLHGGILRAQSEGLGKGSVFSVTLPYEADCLAQPAEIAQEITPGQSCKIMVVDDIEDVAESLAMMLRLHGYDAQSANDLEGALKLAGEFQPKLALLDIGMPDADGFEVKRRLQTLPGMSDCIYIAVTGYGDNEMKERVQSAGFAYHLLKPVAFKPLQQLIQSALIKK